VWLEKNGLKLGDIVAKEWAPIDARSAGTLSWQPNRKHVLIAKWQAACKKLVPGNNVVEEIDMVVVFAVAGGRTRQHRERVLILVDWINGTMLHWV